MVTKEVNGKFLRRTIQDPKARMKSDNPPGCEHDQQDLKQAAGSRLERPLLENSRAFSWSVEHECALEYAPPLLGTRRALSGVLIRAPKSIRSRKDKQPRVGYPHGTPKISRQK